ncbi:MAG: hypothetical protein L0312_13410 [Acidobacteria bacterium]|nr:hypothetical protein [Acidobacteriota bacterium]
MSRTWECREYDRDFFAKELDSFIPDKIFDAHAHLYKLSHWGCDSASLFEKGPALVSFEEYQRQIEWLTPGRKTSGFFLAQA